MELLKKFSIKPLDPHLYELAFLHESYSNENNLEECYERLEFLGDAALDLVVSEFLYNMDSDLTEGQLTRIRSNYVCKKALYTYSIELGLDQYIKLGAGVELTKRETDSVISDVFESFIGALYLDLGMESVKEFLFKTVIPHIKNKDIFFYDYKSELKQLCDQNGFELIYELIHEEGEPHDKIFTMAAMINGEKCGIGNGGSKKEAEQNAAKIALSEF
ncbi:MAG: ribonuclease III [Methanobacterium sp.]|uniref:ribonuclease III n=1 Tax=Methanobacterium sp. TaxID=2164 RepID=UPI003D64C084|nr:ribonuclease III [Methanobacterium sp.]